MKIGIISDIHNNVIALEAVLQRFRIEKCHKIICAGDIIGIGPYPEETVQMIMSIPNLIAVKGNHEKYLSDGLPVQFPNDECMKQEEIEAHKWEHQLLSESSVSFLYNLPYRADLIENGKRITVIHYCLTESNTFFKPKKNIVDLFSFPSQDIIIYGHDHIRNICKNNSKWFINCGSLGCPGNSIFAKAAILEISKDGNIFVKELNIEYDITKVINDIDRLDYPSASEIKHIFFGRSH